MIELSPVERVSVIWHSRVIGQLAMTPKRLCAFQYDPEFVRTGHSVSPLKLPLSDAVQVATRDPFRGGFGVFDDSLPDGWGALVLDLFLRRNSIDPASLTLLQRLAMLGNTGRGALEYAPAFPLQESETLDITDLAMLSGEILEAHEITADEINAVFAASGSSGGARPKAFVRLQPSASETLASESNVAHSGTPQTVGGQPDDGEWLVKFPASSDPTDVGAIEYECSLIAQECAIEMSPTRLIAGRHFAAARFDRSAAGKIHIVSAAGLLNADYRMPSLDYETLLRLTLWLTRDLGQARQMFTRMILNILIANRDDH
ncbi:MAG: type II toxin-antitoxin system HipA family toxin, partial [Propionibacteriaceae bacterium]|nr:type II toxin-antitoxin system HipA family toxin [Propionibacteriaceae bacterium]